MTNTKSTKRALLVSVMAMVICFTMLLGTTFAWFTDSETSTGNVITSGKLDVIFEYSEDGTNYSSATDTKIFKYTNWEPGYADIKQVRISNNGTLDFNYKLRIVGDLTALTNVIDVYCFEGTNVTRTQLDPNAAGTAYLGTLAEVANAEDFAIGTLADGDAAKVYTIVLKMNEDAGNEYQEKTFSNFSVQVLATQLSSVTSENDRLGTDYDEDATYSNPALDGSDVTAPPTDNQPNP